MNALPARPIIPDTEPTGTLPRNPRRTVFKIVKRADWAAAQATGVYTGSIDDRRDGFIHLSDANQVAATLQRHFRGQTELVLVAFYTDELGPPLRYETSRGGALFPHYYAPLPTGTALWVKDLPLDDDGQPVCDVEWLEC